VRRIFVLFALLLICNLAGADVSRDDAKVALGEEFSIEVGQSTVFVNKDLNIQILNILEDSICPEDAQCIWAGVVVIHVKVKHGQTEEEYLFADSPGQKSYNGIPRVVVAGDYNIQFLKLEKNAIWMKVFKETNVQDNDLSGVWSVHKDGTLSNEWHHAMGKITKKSKVSATENIKDEKAGTKVIGTYTE